MTKTLMNIVLIAAAITVVSHISCIAQELATGTQRIETWRKLYGGSDMEEAYSIINTADGGFIFAGETHSYGAGRSDAWLVKLDAHGNKEWDKSYGTKEDEYAVKLSSTSDGGWIVMGWRFMKYIATPYSRLYRVDAAGNTLWEKKYDDEMYRLWDVTGAPEGSVYVAGTEYPSSKFDITNWVNEFNVKGEQLPKHFYKIKHYIVTSPFFVSTNNGGGATVAAEYVEGEKIGKVVDVIARDGSLVSRKMHSKPPINCGTKSVKSAPSGGFVISGFDNKRKCACAIMFDAAGEILWGKTYEYSKHGSIFYAAVPLDDGSIAFAGAYATSSSDDHPELWLVMTDAQGNVTRQKRYADAEHIKANSIISTPDGGIIVAGRAHPPSSGYADALIMKLDRDFEYAH